ncbi:DUF262 domain-containing protein [Aliarcobacter butzleri]|uniref:DUF262 domain-containing protein n=1 Tax=Aliarcobacter butzleri TaxID=28197 RepID=UPI003B213A80
MKCNPTDVEIEVLLRRVKGNELELQPSFQRGEVWSIQKQKRLIDTILREWKIPPIHIIRNENYKDEVLDGQQRLAAIRDFCCNKFGVDGTILPFNERIASCDRKTFEDLDEKFQRLIMRYSITIITLTDYLPEEPAELFYRLNQPSTLTSAEQRNAFISQPRDQVKELTDYFIEKGASSTTIGFSNSRLAYDEIISKYCYTLELKTLKKKITSNDLSDKYRNNISFDESSLLKAKRVINILMNVLSLDKPEKIKLNKATLFSWFIFISKNIEEITSNQIEELFYRFEKSRQNIKKKNLDENKDGQNIIKFYNNNQLTENLLLIFNQRSSMGSTDANSIIIRDIIIHLFFYELFDQYNQMYILFNEIYRENRSVPITLEDLITLKNWGEKI